MQIQIVITSILFGVGLCIIKVFVTCVLIKTSSKQIFGIGVNGANERTGVSSGWG